MSIYRGPGGSSDAVNDATVTAVAGYAASAATSANAATTSAEDAATFASASAASASSAATSITNVSIDATNASTGASLANAYAANASSSASAAAASAALAQLAAGSVPANALSTDDFGNLAISGTINSGDIVVEKNPDIPGDYASIFVDGKGNGSFLFLMNGDAEFADTATQFYAYDSGVDILAPAINLFSSGIFKVAVGGSSAFSINTSGNCAIGNVTATAKLDVQGNTIRLRTARTPASATAAGNLGDICWDSNYIYVCVSSNTWKRTALSTW
jgi:hypothetical protein